MDASTRKAKLIELQANENNVAMTGIPLRYKGETRTVKVYRIPLDYLIYNKYNGRIGTDVLSYERQNGILDAEKDEDRTLIERFLYESKKERNETTLKSLQQNRQQRYGIVTADGTIVDGNRRAMLLNRLFHKHAELGYTYDETHIYGKRSNCAKNPDRGLYYAGIWQELGLKESDACTEWARNILL